VKSPELFYGLSVLGRVHPDRVVTNAGARPGDRLVLTKPIGTGVLTTALKRGTLSADRLAAVTATMKRLNDHASRLMVEHGAHACTDITGYGLLGHLHEMTSASATDAEVRLDQVPLLEGALEHAREGAKPGGLGANRTYLAGRVDLPEGADPERIDLLFDPQTSGGLLISIPPERSEALLHALHAEGRFEGWIIGEMRAGSGRIRVRP
jgi:selenide,water dikinase